MILFLLAAFKAFIYQIEKKLAIRYIDGYAFLYVVDTNCIFTCSASAALEVMRVVVVFSLLWLKVQI